jgi:hypothetical protein
MPKARFIRAIEVWLPTPDGAHLDLDSGHYGDLAWFGGISRGMRVAANEGLPGRAAAAGHPLVLDKLTNSYFRRGDAAMTEGLTCAVALPIFDAQGLSAVMVFLCGDSRHHIGALEVWHAAPGKATMALVDGYFGHADAFATLTRDFEFAAGQGVPGLAWDSGRPLILSDISAGSAFQRSVGAGKTGIDRAVGIPCATGGDASGDWVLTFLSSRNSPIAGRFESWLPDAGGMLSFAGGYCESGTALEDTHAGLSVARGEGAIGRAAASGRPVLFDTITGATDAPARAAGAAGLTAQVAMPVFKHGELRAVLAWYQ